MPAPTSAARIAANRLNAKKSTGPRTEEGKARSRRNAVKHGLAGRGVALPIEDEAAVEGRFLGLQGELAPATILGTYFAHEVALATVRTQRAVRLETACLAHKIRHAAADFEEARRAEAEHTLGYIGMEPITHRRRLKATPEGVDALVLAFRNLRRDLEFNRERWDYSRELLLEAYLGRRLEEVPVARSRALSQAIQGNREFLDADDREAIGLAPHPLAWARSAMLDFLDAEIADLLAHRATLDFAAIERDRAEAGERALFDAGRDAALARRYEAAARRDLYRALDEFRAVEAAALEDTEAFGDEPEAIALGDALDAPRPGPQAEPEPAPFRPGRANSFPAATLASALGSSREVPPADAPPPEPGDAAGLDAEFRPRTAGAFLGWGRPSGGEAGGTGRSRTDR